ncbi:Thioredoxin [Dyella sp. OK004]|uniref:eCIS core domain-containing protein n=1 Tax=Dyella sp. OK004 TaxID=1855292 RepID=UPI0008DEE3E8|nr:DUF4157 domain-containing protein [Dyella sp. OK004]SFS14365.1 Thioredoxin [Dyella sp. OK004]
MSFRYYRAASARRSMSVGSVGHTMLQRKCECGTHTDGGECEECASKKQALQRKASSAHAGDAPAIVYDVLRGPGQPMDASSQAFMESRFDRDFSHVRVHTGEQAGRSAQAVHAQAYTVGRDIVFDSGMYAPSSEQGRRLLAHELAHVAQQDGASSPPGGAIAVSDLSASEAHADSAADAALAGAPATDTAAASAGLQRKEAKTEAPANDPAAAATGAPAATGPCIEEVVGEDISSLLQAGAVTIVEFGAVWCQGCQQNKSGLEEICAKLRKQPPSVPVRFYSVDTDNDANKKSIEGYVDRQIPHLYIYVGNTEKAHINEGLEFDALNALVTEQIDYASTSGWWRGAKKGALWGLLPGGVGGLAGAIAIGAGAGGLSGNAQMGAILGTLAGGAAAGMLLGGAVGAIAGAATDDRNKGPRDQKRRKLQPKQRDAHSTDSQEREADEWAERAGGGTAHASRGTPAASPAKGLPSGEGGEPMDGSTLQVMEDRFGRDFSRVRLHRDGRAQHLTGAMNAYAVTSGSDVYLAQDAYAPDTREGRTILGHELAHVTQNESSAPAASVASLEREAAIAGASVADGRTAQIMHGSKQSLLAMTRGEQTAAGIGIGAATVGAAGALIGLGVAAAMHNQPFGMGALIGGAIGVGVGALVGGLIGGLSRNTTSETVPEADMLIRRRYGRYLPGGIPAALRAARVHAVSRAELCERHECRTHDPDCGGLIGWTDTGPAVQPISGRAPTPLPSATAEPTCHGQQLEHATPQQPVIYYIRSSETAGTLLHEGLHAYSHPDFAFLHNYVVEGTTEYFTRKLQDEINMPYGSGYDDRVVGVNRLVEAVGEETLARAYFTGEVPALHRAFNARYGRCALITWAFAKAPGVNADRFAEEILAGGPRNDYCQQSQLPFDSAALTPGEQGYQPPTPPEQPSGEPKP